MVRNWVGPSIDPDVNPDCPLCYKYEGLDWIEFIEETDERKTIYSCSSCKALVYIIQREDSNPVMTREDKIKEKNKSKEG